MAYLFIFCKRTELIYRAIIIIFGLLSASFLLQSCAHYRRPCHDFASASHPLYNIIPRHRSQIEWYDAGSWIAWSLFGNDDDGIFGEAAGFQPNQTPSCLKAMQWYLRNPLHNFCFYVIGTAWMENSELTILEASGEKAACFIYKPKGDTVFPSKNSCFFLALHGWKPFVSLRICFSKKRRADFYAGWRERGNFGLAFRIQRPVVQ